MPAWLLRLAPYLFFALALGAAVWYIDHRGYSRALTEAERDKLQAALTEAQAKELFDQMVKDVEESIRVEVAESDARITTRLNSLDVTNKTIIQPTLEREIRSEVRYSDPTAGISDGMLRELNRARQLSQRPCSPTSSAVACYTLPSLEQPERQDDSNVGN